MPPSGMRLDGLIQRRGAPKTRICFCVTSLSGTTQVPKISIVANVGANFILLMVSPTGVVLYSSGISSGKVTSSRLPFRRLETNALPFWKSW